VADCASDAERLDPFNGLLLAVRWDAAFDCGLVTFADNGAVQLSGKCPMRRAVFCCARRHPLLASQGYGLGTCRSCGIIEREFGDRERLQTSVPKTANMRLVASALATLALARRPITNCLSDSAKHRGAIAQAKAAA
jgi:hypothetical protein